MKKCSLCFFVLWVFSALIKDLTEHGNDYYIFTDHLGTPFAWKHLGTGKITYTPYSPWGELLANDPDRDPPPYAHGIVENVGFDIPNLPGFKSGIPPIGLAGHYYQHSTGLVNMHYRWYSPRLGTFLTPDFRPPNIYDPSSFTQPYAYAAGNPVMYWDEDGLDILPGGLHADMEEDLAEKLREKGVGVKGRPVVDQFLESLGLSLIDIYSGTPGKENYAHHFYKVLAKNNEVAFVITPDKLGAGDLSDFKQKIRDHGINVFTGVAAPGEYNAYSAASMQSLISGQPQKAIEYFGKAWRSALTDPGWYIYSGTIIASGAPRKQPTSFPETTGNRLRINLNPETNPQLLPLKGRVVPGGVGTNPKINLAGISEVSETFTFRGTTKGFPGSRGMQMVGVSSSSPDPAVATIFSIEAQTYGQGVVHIASTSRLGPQMQGNVLASIESESVYAVTPKQFAARANLTITTEQSRAILNDMGIKLPGQIATKARLDQLIRETPRMTPEQIEEFLRRASELAQ